MLLKMTEFIYRYSPLLPGILIKRYRRFLADIKLDSGEIITAHCPNTGAMTGVCQPGNRVQVSVSDNPKRKLAYTWEMIEVNGDTWVGIKTNLPNRVVRLGLEKRIFAELNPYYREIQSEVVYGITRKSRIDFLLTGDALVYLELTLPAGSGILGSMN